MWRYTLSLTLVVILLDVISIQAASTYSYSQANSQDYPLPIYPIQQQQASTQQSLLQGGSTNFGFQNRYPYQIFGAAAIAESARNQDNNYAYVNQPPRTSYAPSQLTLPREQLQQQRLPFWMGRPIVADYVAEQYTPATATSNVYPNMEYQSLRNNEYNRETLRPGLVNFSRPQQNHGRFTPYINDGYYRQSQIGSPSSRDIAFLSAQNSLVPFQASRFSTAADYANHFDRYLRKYPERLQPTYIGNSLRE